MFVGVVKFVCLLDFFLGHYCLRVVYFFGWCLVILVCFLLVTVGIVCSI